MLRGYRLYVLALGLVLLGAGEAPKNSGQPKQQDAKTNVGNPPAHILSAPDPAKAIEPPEYYKPCAKAGDKGSSDLCAQWSAAQAARDAADWAWSQLWLSALGVVGLGVTLWFNFEAWNQARKSKVDTERALNAAENNATAALRLADTAESNAKKELRAYLDFDGMIMERWPDYDPKYEDNVGVRHRVTIQNYGKTPAENVTLTISHFVKIPSGKTALLVENEGEVALHTIAPHDASHKQSFWGLKPKLVEQFESGEWVCHSSIIVTYTDV